MRFLFERWERPWHWFLAASAGYALGALAVVMGELLIGYFAFCWGMVGVIQGVVLWRKRVEEGRK